MASWSCVDWFGIETREDLILARMRQLDERVLNESRAAAELERSRKGNKAYFDQHKRIRDQPLKVGDLVLLHDTGKFTTRNLAFKLHNKWKGPYRVHKVGSSGYYWLEELDGVEMAKPCAGDRLKKFFSREELDEDWEERQNRIRDDVGRGEERMDDAVDDDEGEGRGV